MKSRNNIKLRIILSVFLFSLITIGLFSFFMPKSFSNFIVIETMWSGEIASNFDGGNGTKENPYRISNGEELAYLEYVLENKDYDSYKDKYYILTSNINMGGNEFGPIGDRDKLFMGHLDGDGHTLSNIKISSSVAFDNNVYSGLFAVLDNASVENLNIINSVVNVEALDNSNIGLLAGEIKNSSVIKNVSIYDNTIELTNTNENMNVGGLAGKINESNISYMYLDNDIKGEVNSYNLGYVDDKSLLDNLLVKGNKELNSNIEIKNVDNNKFLDILNQNKTDDYFWELDEDNYVLVRNEPSIQFKQMSLLAESSTIELHDSGKEGDTVYVNDLEADYNYYKGLNYTYDSKYALPSLKDKGFYTDANLVKMQITYDSSSTKNGEVLTGKVSLRNDEQEKKFVYYKTYPVNNAGTPDDKSDDYVEIELPDNIFTARPMSMGFNGWATAYPNVVIRHDKELYRRLAKIPVTYSGNIPNEIVINFNAKWVKANVVMAGSSLSTSTYNNLLAPKMYELEKKEKYVEIVEKEVNDYSQIPMDNYYRKYSTGFFSSYPTGAVNSSNESVSGICFNSNCTYYLKESGYSYKSGETYYIWDGTEFKEERIKLPYLVEVTEEKERVAFNENDNMSTFFEQVIIPRNSSIVGYYDANGKYLASGTCTTSSGCTYYKIIQYYDESGRPNNYDENKKYYYLATRDTNIIVLNNNITLSSLSSDKPATLTSQYNGVTYNVTIQHNGIQINNETTIENVNLSQTGSSNSTSIPGSSTNGVIYGNSKNVKMGRGLNKVGSTKTTTAYVSANTSETFQKYRVIIESGYYNVLSLSGGSNTANKNIEVYGIYGNDYDRVTNNNSNLDVYFCASGSWGNNINSNNSYQHIMSAFRLTVKSGDFGSRRPTASQDSNEYYSYGIYVGGRNGGKTYAAKEIIVEGGSIYNLIGGPLTDASQNVYNDVMMYIKGGSIDAIYGGAGRTETYGNRIIQMTGGKVNYSIFGGSNGITGSNGDGKLDGKTYIYVGGNAIIGTKSDTLYDAEAGSIFGVGNGRNYFSTSNYKNIGTTMGANIVLDGNAIVNGNIYGGGNYGGLGTGYNTATNANILINGGTVKGNVYGGANKNDSGKSDYASNVNITMNSGVIEGSIYGGANTTGIVYGNVNININGGKVLRDIYGGGQGGYTGSSTANLGTYVRNKINITVGNSSLDTIPEISGSLYGGSAYGMVNGTNNSSTTKSNDGINIIVNKGIITDSVYGGGRGMNNITPKVNGPINVQINGGNIGNVYGANDYSGIPISTIDVYLKGGVIGNVYGGGNRIGMNTSTIYQEGSTVLNSIFGGSNQAGTVTKTNIIITGGSTNNVYGGNNLGGTAKDTNVTIKSGDVLNTIYGGGYQASSEITHVKLEGGTTKEVYGGGENANVTTSTNIVNTGISYNGEEVKGTKGVNIYGGSNAGGNIPVSYINSNSDKYVYSIYGGNNANGLTSNSNITINKGDITYVFGGGNNAGVTNTNISLLNGNIGSVYGGSNQKGEVTKSTIVTSGTSGTISVGDLYGGNNLGGDTIDTNISLNYGTYNNIFGGGNRATTNGISNIRVKNVEIKDSIYGGGNNAALLGDTHVYIGDNTTIEKSVFGGGNRGAVGSENGTPVTAKVDIVGATIGKNVYGGCNRSSVYGETKVNIGVNAVGITNLPDMSDISIGGTIFGGGDSNEEGSVILDYDAISVTKGIDIVIDGTGYEDKTFKISGSIFGSGNASSSAGESNILIRKLGTRDNPNTAVSIQRTDTAIIDNSSLEFTGTIDTANFYSDKKYSLNRIKVLKVKNNSDLLLNENANMLSRFESLVDINGVETKAEVKIDADNFKVVKNVDNRLYMRVDQVLNVTTDEAATSYGVVYGMTFLGMYQKYANGAIVYGIYDSKYNSGDAAGEEDVLNGSTSVLGLHNFNHNIKVDGFYTNYIDEDFTFLTTKYVEPTPPAANFYLWAIGSQAINFSISLTASKYSSLGTVRLAMVNDVLAKGNTIFNITGVNTDGLSEDIILRDSKYVPKLANTEEEANSIMGLSLKTETSEWTSHGTTKFIKENGEKAYYTGDDSYMTDNQSLSPTLMFYLYHAKNVSSNRELGTVVVTMQAIVYRNEIEYDVYRINVNIALATKEYDDDDAYDSSITYSKKYDMPLTTPVNITNRSQFTAYYSVFAKPDKHSDFYGIDNDYYHALISDYALPVGTKITMIDYGYDEFNPKYYYYIVDEEKYNKAVSMLKSDNEVAYRLSDFIKMDSIDAKNTYSETESNQKYYHDDLNVVMEEFIFIFDFKNTTTSEVRKDNSILFELRNSEDRTEVTVLGVQQNSMQYSLYEEGNSVLSANVKIDNPYVYYDISKDINSNIKISYNQTDARQAIIDTNYEDSNLGMNITLFDSSDNQISSSLLRSATVFINDEPIYEDRDGVYRIKLADKVSNINKIVSFTTGSSLPVGKYKMRVEIFASNDGLHNNMDNNPVIKELDITVIGDENLVIADIPDKEKVIDGDTGLNMNGLNRLNVNLKYASVLNNPNIRLIVYKRDTTDSTTAEYLPYDVKKILVNSFNLPTGVLDAQEELEYMITSKPQKETNYSYTLKANLESGTYRFVFRLYDGNQLIDESQKYIIIRKKIS